MHKFGKIQGVSLCFILAIPCLFLGELLPIVGAPVFAILAGIVVGIIIKKYFSYKYFRIGVSFTSKKVLQWAVILLGFGLNLSIIFKTGKQSLPIIVTTILVAVLTAFILQKFMKLNKNLSILIGVGSSICGGSAIAATAPVVKADDNEVAHSISVIFLFNVLAALIFPTFGGLVGFDTTLPEPFAVFAGTAVNDTSSVTATASTWDSIHHLGTQTLDQAVTVKLTRTLAIIPITFILAVLTPRETKENKFTLKGVFPMFIIYFILASVITTVALQFGASPHIFDVAKFISKFFIIMAMAAIGINTNVNAIIKSGFKPILFGFACWIMIIITTLGMQYLLGIW